MTMQELSTAIQYDLPIKVFILNNQWMGMVRQWQCQDWIGLADTLEYEIG